MGISPELPEEEAELLPLRETGTLDEAPGPFEVALEEPITGVEEEELPEGIEGWLELVRPGFGTEPEAEVLPLVTETLGEGVTECPEEVPGEPMTGVELEEPPCGTPLEEVPLGTGGLLLLVIGIAGELLVGSPDSELPPLPVEEVSKEDG